MTKGSTIGCRLWRSTNVKAATPSWTSIKPSIGSEISAIVAAPGNSDIIWVGHNNGNAYKTTNGTAASPTWTQVDTNTPNLPNRYVTRITIDRNNGNIVYVTFGGFSPDNIWRTTNGGLNWTDITGTGLAGLPDLPVRSLIIHPENSNWLYAGTELGIFTSEDAGSNWALPHDGPTNTSVDELFWMNTTVVAATHGRGLFKALASPLAVTLSSFASVVEGDHLLITWETVSEVNNLGFNLYRSASADGEQVLLANVPSQAPGSTSGATHRYEDSAVTAGQTYWYWLEDIDLNGATTLHGPVSVVYQAPTAVTLTGVNASSAAPLTVPGALSVAVAGFAALSAGLLARRRRP